MSGPARLGPATVAALPPAVARPTVPPAELATGIVHLGIGAFARAHLIPLTEAAMAATGDRGWGVCGVSLRAPDTRDALAPQHGLYALALRDGAGERLQVVGALRELLVAPEDPGAVLARIAQPQVHVVSLTVTEKGHGPDPAADPAGFADFVAHDLAQPLAPRTAIGLIVHALARRFATHGDGALTLLSLDNLAANGEALKRRVLALARRVDAALAERIDRTCAFPNSMVDRIVPRTTDADRAAVAVALGGVHDAWPVVAEPFCDWALEDRFAGPRPAWERAGVNLVPDAAPYERLKLRLVNGSHSAIAYLGMLAGWTTVDEAMAQPPLRRFVEALMREEMLPTVGALPGLDAQAHVQRLLARFDNPALAHRLAQIAMDGTQKLPQRWVAPLRERLAAGAPVERLALCVAAWCTWLRGHDEAGTPHALDDPLAPALKALHAHALAESGVATRARRFAAFAPVFGDLAGDARLEDALASALRALEGGGVAAGLAGLR
jgi:fructuronate reductase